MEFRHFTCTYLEGIDFMTNKCVTRAIKHMAVWERCQTTVSIFCFVKDYFSLLKTKTLSEKKSQ